MQITVPDNLNLPARARAAGFASAGAFVAHLVRHAPPAGGDGAGASSEPERDPRTLTYEEWRKEFDELLALAKARGGSGGFVDCSRDAIYGNDGRLTHGEEE